MNSAVFSPDGHFILTASSDGTARVWDAATGEMVRTLQGHVGAVYNAAYSPDGRFIVTAGQDRTARIWEADYREFIAYACTRVFRDLTESERVRFSVPFDLRPTCA